MLSPLNEVHAVTSLAGRWVRLRPVSRADYVQLFHWRSDVETVHLWNLSRRVASYEEFAAGLEQALSTSLFYGVIDLTTDRPIGYAQTYNPSPWDRWLYAAFYLIPQYRGQPHFMEAALLSLDALFRWYPIHKVYTEVYEFAENVHRILSALGFVEEGYTPNHFWYDGRYWGLWRFALYAESWPQCRERSQGVLKAREERSK
jgi:RimJ/RimL family protein N-acetyltransferase